MAELMRRGGELITGRPGVLAPGRGRLTPPKRNVPEMPQIFGLVNGGLLGLPGGEGGALSCCLRHVPVRDSACGGGQRPGLVPSLLPGLQMRCWG